MMPPRAGRIIELSLGAARQSLAQFGAESHGKRVTIASLRRGWPPRATGQSIA